MQVQAAITVWQMYARYILFTYLGLPTLCFAVVEVSAQYYGQTCKSKSLKNMHAEYFIKDNRNITFYSLNHKLIIAINTRVAININSKICRHGKLYHSVYLESRQKPRGGQSHINLSTSQWSCEIYAILSIPRIQLILLSLSL